MVCCLPKMSMETPHPESTVGEMRWHRQTQHECGTIIHSDLCIKNQPAKISDSVSRSVSAVASQFRHHKFKSSCNNVLIGEHCYIQTKHNLVTAKIEFLVIFLCLFMILLLIFHKYVNFFKKIFLQRNISYLSNPPRIGFPVFIHPQLFNASFCEFSLFVSGQLDFWGCFLSFLTFSNERVLTTSYKLST